MRISTSPSPIAPALTLSARALAPIVAVCTDELISVRFAGRAPPLMSAESPEASVSENPPGLVISQDLELIFSCTDGAEMTSSSSAITIALLATGLPSSSVIVDSTSPLKAFSVASAKRLEPSDVKSMVIL